MNCFKITWALAILLENRHKKFEINQTKIKGDCQSGRYFFLFLEANDSLNCRLPHIFPTDSPLNLCLICLKITWALAILLEHMHKKFEINQTTIEGCCQSGRYCWRKQLLKVKSIVNSKNVGLWSKFFFLYISELAMFFQSCSLWSI